MCKTYTLEDNDGLMAELKSMHGKMAEMRGRLERDEISRHSSNMVELNSQTVQRSVCSVT